MPGASWWWWGGREKGMVTRVGGLKRLSMRGWGLGEQSGPVADAALDTLSGTED